MPPLPIITFLPRRTKSPMVRSVTFLFSVGLGFPASAGLGQKHRMNYPWLAAQKPKQGGGLCMSKRMPTLLPLP